jgi:TonB-linked SusC/RagA family outer membrane protein
MKNITLLAIGLFWIKVSFSVSLCDTLKTNEKDINQLFNFQVQTNPINNKRSIFEQQINYTPLNSLQDILQGAIPGVQIVGQGGFLAQDFHIFIRGNSSFIGKSNPLIVIDGIIPLMENMDYGAQQYSSINHLQSLNLSDIESIEILKNGYAAALYGNEAANGAIVIKTKKGIVNRPKLSYSSQAGIANTNEVLKMMNREQYISLISATFNLSSSFATWEDKMDYLSPNWRKGYDSNWQEEIFNSSLWYSNRLSVIGGSKLLNYYSSMNWTRQKGTVIGNNSENLSGRLNLSFTPCAWFKIDGGIAPSNSKISRVLNAGNLQSPMMASIIVPTEPIFLNNGDGYNEIFNQAEYYEPFGLGALNKSILNKLPFYFYAKIKPLKSISLNALFAGEKSQLLYNNYNDYLRALEGMEKAMVLVQDYSASFIYQLPNSGEINAKVGIRNQLYNFENKYNNIDNNYNYFYNKYKRAVFGSFLNTSLSFDNRFFINSILRNEFSSTNEKADGNNPMIIFFTSAQYVLLKNKFLDDKKNMGNLLAISGSYSIVKRGMPIYPIKTNFSLQILYSNKIEFETIKHFDIGFQYELLNRRINGELTYFNKVIDDMLIAKPNFFNGYIIENEGKLRNEGIEFVLNSTNITGVFNWKSGLNITYLTSEIKDSPIIGASGGFNPLFKGELFDAFFIYNYMGVNETTGQPLLETNSGEVNYPSNDSKRVKAGNPQPKFYGGFANWLSYGNFDINLFIQFVYGNHLYDNGLERLTTNSYINNNRTQEYFENVWINEGDNARYPRLGTLNQKTTLHLYDASYIRLKTLTIGYNISKLFLNRYSISSARLYIDGNNLFTLSKYKGWNVDLYGVAYFNAPSSKVFSLGIQIDF